MRNPLSYLSVILLLSGVLVGCGSGKMKDGAFVTTTDGHNGPIRIETVIQDGAIAEVHVLEHSETAGISDAALERIPNSIVKYQSLAVDSVSGATMVSRAIIDGVAEGVKQAGGNVDKMMTPIPQAEVKTETYDADVVVVGAGGAGAAAAVTAAEGGLKVLLIEKSANPGGTTLFASGLFATDSYQQEAQGIVVPSDEVYQEWQEYTCWLNDSTLTWNFFKKSASTIEWLEERGYELELVPNVQKVHEGGWTTYHSFQDESKKMDYLLELLSHVESNGGSIMYETRAVKLLKQNGAVSGVQAVTGDGTRVFVNADAVILATGGFGASVDVMDTVTGGVNMSQLNSGTQTGDGIAMVREVGGADLAGAFAHYHGVDMPFDVIMAAGVIDDKGARGGIEQVNHFANYPGALWVSSQGNRFASEAICYDSALVANATYAVGGNYYVIVDQKSVNALERGGSSELGITLSPERLAGQELAPTRTPWAGLTEQFDLAVELGGAFKGDTVEELAEAIGIDAGTLVETVDTYNGICESGVDEQHRKEAMYLIPVREGPFYAVKGQTVALGGLGGIRTNSRLNVTDASGATIKGLYAAGNDVNEIYNNVYPLVEGVTCGWAFNSGRMAGEAVLDDFMN